MRFDPCKKPSENYGVHCSGCYTTRCSVERVSPEEAPYVESSDPSKRFIVLRGKRRGNCFFSANSGTYRSDWYTEIACVDTMHEAWVVLYGPDFADREVARIKARGEWNPEIGPC